MNKDTDDLIEHENANWTKVFQEELKNKNDKKFSSFWWKDYYEELISYIDKIILNNSLYTILEAGSGSGKATILLDKRFKKTLLDISPAALKYAKYLSEKFDSKIEKFIVGNVFSMPFKGNNFDFVWNVGLIEHYDLKNIELIIKEMGRICSSGGIVAVGMPNFWSGPIIKAWLLKALRFFPGYKIDTEKFYKIAEIEKIFNQAGKDLGKEISYIKIEYFGNPLIMESPKFILETIGKIFSKMFRKNKFLILMVCKFK